MNNKELFDKLSQRLTKSTTQGGEPEFLALSMKRAGLIASRRVRMATIAVYLFIITSLPSVISIGSYWVYPVAAILLVMSALVIFVNAQALVDDNRQIRRLGSDLQLIALDAILQISLELEMAEDSTAKKVADEVVESRTIS